MVAFQNPGQFREVVYAFQTSRIILTAYELELFSVLDDRKLTSAEVAALLVVDTRALDRLMNALCAIGLLHKEAQLFGNGDFAARYLVKGKPEYLETFGHTLNMWDTWSFLTSSVKTGKRAPRKKKNPAKWTRAFIAAMHGRAKAQADDLVGLLDLSGVKRLLDVGGGSGVYSMAMIRRQPGIHATVFDLPEVIRETHRYVKAEGMTNQFSYLAGDYHVDDLGSGYDLIFLSAIVHINSFEENARLIARCSAALNPGGQIVIQDHLMDEDRTAPVAGAFFALNMLVATERGDTYTEQEMRSWFTSCGINDIKVIPVPNNALIIGTK